MNVYAYEYPTTYQIIVTDGTEQNTLSYDFGKEQSVEVSANEALLLAQAEISKAAVPTPVIL